MATSLGRGSPSSPLFDAGGREIKLICLASGEGAGFLASDKLFTPCTLYALLQLSEGRRKASWKYPLLLCSLSLCGCLIC
ncbi:hypothetical protein CEXT_543391 [Caerostris extrusa]|uniref:Uncharacterized protein n=1 Tax=Caerostris extrusa TaxID=172846 RepID=A0AAV4VNT2_CAEEX|nr:hypothetical protein CEXT_543391 [Caerostris extrusa]